MNYRDQQAEKATKTRDEIFHDPGNGQYNSVAYEFVLSRPELNLWEGIRADAIEYFKRNSITWDKSTDIPTGHLLSSQVACVNHLYWLRQRPDMATAVLRSIDPQITSACRIDSGFVEFEKVGQEPLGEESALTRGAYTTSIDAMMVGETLYGKRILYLIEWKYTESYTGESRAEGESGKTRIDAYKKLLSAPQCPITHAPSEDLYYEPFYQLMRQTLLGWEMVRRREYGVEDWRHLHIIPQGNPSNGNRQHSCCN